MSSSDSVIAFRDPTDSASPPGLPGAYVPRGLSHIVRRFANWLWTGAANEDDFGAADCAPRNLRLAAGARTVLGAARCLNEDAIQLDIEHGVFVVADGMGGYAAGQLASRAVVDLVLRRMIENHPRLTSSERVAEALTAAIAEADVALKELSLDAAQDREIGSTVVAAAVWQGTLTVAHVGDSRAYLCRHGRLEPLTSDHTLAREMVQAGILSHAEEAGHPYRNILSRNLGRGSGNHTADVTSITLRPGDRILLATDGLTGVLSQLQMEQILCRHVEPQPAADALIDAAARLKARDDVSCILVDVRAAEPQQS